MPQVKNSRGYETFADGLLTICDADERILTKTKLDNIRYGKRTVGVTRFWQAKTAGNKVDKLVAVPLETADAAAIEVNDIVIVKNAPVGGQYQIVQIQPKFDTKPPSLYLTLEKLVHPFKDGRQ